MICNICYNGSTLTAATNFNFSLNATPTDHYLCFVFCISLLVLTAGFPQFSTNTNQTVQASTQQQGITNKPPSVSIFHSHAVESYRAVCKSYLDTSDCRALWQLLQDPRLCWLRVMLMRMLNLWCLTTGTLSGWAVLRSSSGAAEAGELLSLWPPLPHWKCLQTHTWQDIGKYHF